MCPDCNGLGMQMTVDMSRGSSPTRSARSWTARCAGTVSWPRRKSPWGIARSESGDSFRRRPGQPWQDLPEHFRNVVLYGSGEEKVRFTYQGEWSEGTYSGESHSHLQGHHTHDQPALSPDQLGRDPPLVRQLHERAALPRAARVRGCAREARGVTVGGKTISEVDLHCSIARPTPGLALSSAMTRIPM